MSYGTTGFGGAQLYPQPQVFQALSLSGAAPVAPVQPYGTPNQNLVPVRRTGNPAVPANLSLAAQPVFAAILKVNPAIVGISKPPIGATPNTTSSIGATNPSITHALVGTGTGTSPAEVPAGPVSFALTTIPAYVTSSLDALEQSEAPPPSQPAAAQQTAALAQPARATQQTAPSAAASHPALVQRIVQTVTQLAVSAVYPGPVFSFSA